MTSELEFVHYGLRAAIRSIKARGMPEIPLSGQLIRPALAYAAAGREQGVSPEFWSGALAIQYAHEASLVHDDIIDQAKTRRGKATTVESHGVARALVTGDHLLTSAYRLAAETKSIEFVSLFSRSVERTVAGEIDQSKSLGRILTFAEYKSIAEAKSGELLAASLALSAALNDADRVSNRTALGRQLGLLYQMLDDLLDYCPATDTGKPALGDFQQKRWTWPLLELGEFSFEEHHDDIRRRMCERRDKTSALERCIVKIEAEADMLSAKLADEFGNEDVGQSLILSWVARARAAAAREADVSAPPSARITPGSTLLGAVGSTGDVIAHLSRNSQSFRFA
jgi:geranylgeranyl pyrophosphate synthase